jgi:hypothetical protein
MWKKIFEIIFFIEPNSGYFWLDVLLPIFLSFILYGLVYRLVGSMYKNHMIKSKSAGSFFYNLLYFLLLYLTILICNILFSYWKYVLGFSIFILFLFLLIYLVGRKPHHRANTEYKKYYKRPKY